VLFRVFPQNVFFAAILPLPQPLLHKNKTPFSASILAFILHLFVTEYLFSENGAGYDLFSIAPELMTALSTAASFQLVLCAAP
jgi:hypothetical protein